MRWWLRPRFVAPAILLVGAWTTYSTCPGCVDRTRANKDCAWTGDTAFAVDMLDVGHQRHLAADAHLAEELAVRHADLETKRRIGVEHHGGLLDDGRFRRECLDRMLQSIERSHAVTPDQVGVARAQRDWRFDAAVALLFVPLYAMVVIRAVRWVYGRFSLEERGARLAALIAGSFAVGVLGIQVFSLWGAVWETVRVGNGHIGTCIRSAAAANWIPEIRDELLMVAIALFWLFALACHRLESTGPSNDSPAPHKSLLG